jgi:hypothetical protein
VHLQLLAKMAKSVMPTERSSKNKVRSGGSGDWVIEALERAT